MTDFFFNLMYFISLKPVMVLNGLQTSMAYQRGTWGKKAQEPLVLNNKAVNLLRI